MIFQRADKWDAVLLLDEADVFLEQRSLHDVHRNALVSVFLHELKYYQGIMFLTTNRVKQIDDAIASGIHLPLKYKSLGLDARKSTWESFLREAIAEKGEACYNRKDLEFLPRKGLNGRQMGFRQLARRILILIDLLLQIKNIVSTAHALASRKAIRVTIALLEVAIAAGDDFECDFRGAGQVGNMGSYV